MSVLNKCSWSIWIPDEFELAKNTVISDLRIVAKARFDNDEDFQGNWVFRGAFDDKETLPKDIIADKEFIIYMGNEIPCKHSTTEFAIFSDGECVGWFQREKVYNAPLGFAMAAEIIDRFGEEIEQEKIQVQNEDTPNLSDFFKDSYDKHYVNQPKKRQSKKRN